MGKSPPVHLPQCLVTQTCAGRPSPLVWDVWTSISGRAALLQHKMLTGQFGPLLMSDPVGCRKQVVCGTAKEAISLSEHLENSSSFLGRWGELIRTVIFVQRVRPESDSYHCHLHPGRCQMRQLA